MKHHGPDIFGSIVPGLPLRFGIKHAAAAAAPTFTPADLFTGTLAGFWYDPSDGATCWQDAAGTTPAGVDDPVGRIDDKSGNGIFASQSSASLRPIRRQTGGGLWYIEASPDKHLVISTPQDVRTIGAAVSVGSTNNDEGTLVTEAVETGDENSIRTDTGAAWRTPDNPSGAFAPADFTAGAGSGSGRVNGATGYAFTYDVPHIILQVATVDKTIGAIFAQGNPGAPNRYITADLYDLVGIEGTLTTTQRDDLEAFQAARGGVTI